MRTVTRIAAALLLAGTVAACARPSGGQGPGAAEATTASTPASDSHGGAVRDHVSFVDSLRARGLLVEIGGPVRQPFLRPSGTELRLSGGGLASPATIQSYNYDSTDLGTDASAAAQADAAQIGPTGNPKTQSIGWVAAPHFYRADRVLVLYVGSDATVTKLLSEVLGPQFAGA